MQALEKYGLLEEAACCIRYDTFLLAVKKWNNDHDCELSDTTKIMHSVFSTAERLLYQSPGSLGDH